MDFEKVNQAVEKSGAKTKDLLFSPEIGKVLQNIAETNSLDEETSLKMVDEVGYIILGLKERSALKSSLHSIGIPEEAIAPIIQEISRKIFSELDKIQITPEPSPQITEKELVKEEEKENKVEEKSPEGPVIITRETKERVMEELKQRMGTSTRPAQTPNPSTGSGQATDNRQPTTAIHHDLPMVEKGEVVHAVDSKQ